MAALTHIALHRVRRAAVYARKTVTESTWFYWALMSAVFAALTAIFAKLGLTGIDSDLATLLRTIVRVMVLGAFVIASGKWRQSGCA